MLPSQSRYCLLISIFFLNIYYRVCFPYRVRITTASPSIDYFAVSDYIIAIDAQWLLYTYIRGCLMMRDSWDFVTEGHLLRELYRMLITTLLSLKRWDVASSIEMKRRRHEYDYRQSHEHAFHFHGGILIRLPPPYFAAYWYITVIRDFRYHLYLLLRADIEISSRYESVTTVYT